MDYKRIPQKIISVARKVLISAHFYDPPCVLCFIIRGFRFCERFLTNHKIWFEIFTPIGVVVTLIFGIHGIYQTQNTLYLQFRPYVNLTSINFDGKSTITFELSNLGQSVAKDVYFILAKFGSGSISHPDLRLGSEVLDYRATTGNYMIMSTYVGSKDKGDYKEVGGVIPVGMGEIVPNTFRNIKLELENQAEILWLMKKENWISLAIGYKDFLGKENKHYYLMEYVPDKKSFVVIFESENELLPVSLNNVGSVDNYYLSRESKELD